MPSAKQLVQALATHRSEEGTVSARAIHPLCHEHHVPMTRPHTVIVSRELMTYACPQPDCPVRYQVSKGYFMASTENCAQDGSSTLPRVTCPVDSHPMYLGETHREHLSYRLWRCPKCGASKVGGDLPTNSL